MSHTKQDQSTDIADGRSPGSDPEAVSAEDQSTPDRGRRWYHLRPKPRRSTDLMGFNASWWTILLFILLIL